jgi:predicted phage terminase large subunit-like protein
MPNSDILQDLLSPDGIKDPIYKTARLSFWDYCKIRNPKFFRDEHDYQRELASDLQALFEGRLINPATGKPYKKFMINIPPRHGKSYMLILFCEWCFGRDPNLQIISVSYNEKLASRFARAVRDDIDATKIDPKYTIFNDVFPNVHTKYGDASHMFWSLEGSFFSYLATGMGGTITGIGCKLGIIDDPIKNAEEAYNDNVLSDQWDWYRDTFLSRIEEGGLQIVNHTRWSTKDLCGRLLEAAPDEWYVFKRSAYDEEKGEMLCPKILSYASYMDKRSLMSDAIADANFQQKPVDIKGRLYTSFATYDTLPEGKTGRIIAYVDTADLGGDFLCCIVASAIDGQAYVLDILYTDKPMEYTEPAVAAMLYLNAASKAKIESNNGGRGFARSVERLLWENHQDRKVQVEWFTQTANKAARIRAESTFVMRNIIFPSSWIHRFSDFAQAMIGYNAEGKNKHDDAPDAVTGLAEMIQGKERRKLSTMPRDALGI